ncbi:MAG: phosphoenolpyruvate--protein phosphotransferase [Leptolinea sp.]|jgi:phosphotransferase system enzyme I (PtsI)|nr:phosphoenolpyruvate--protein phosphotransferase [Leptolinea sp.]
MKKIQGVASSRGIAIGPVFQFRRSELVIGTCENQDPFTEWKRLESALETARGQITQVYEKALKETDQSQAEIFQFHAMMTEDADLLERVKNLLEERRTNIEPIYMEVCQGYASELAAMDNEYFAARSADVLDVANRVERILLGVAESPTAGLKVPSIIVADDLTPSDTILLDKSLVLGFCTAQGSTTSHAAILARGLGLAAVGGAGNEVLSLAPGMTIILDGGKGVVIADPDQATIATYRQHAEQVRLLQVEAQKHAHEPAITRDGFKPEVSSNIGDVSGAKKAVGFGAEGVGLLRTEFLYMDRPSMPTEEEQYQAYKAILQEFGQMPVVLRTLDIGGDKELPYLKMEPEMNPFLGVRALRLCLIRPDIFKTQLRAALRASVGHNLKIMFPMVATLSEVREAKKYVNLCREELKKEGIPFAENIEVGIMVEIPAAAVCADILGREVDFFSIGTNDLSQYTMAADRGNAGVAHLSDAFQPSVLRLIRDVINASHKYGKWTGMCGELAGEPLAAPLLVGLGLDEFSMSPPMVPVIKALIRTLDSKEMKALAEEALEKETVEEVRDLVRRRVPAAAAVEG